MITNAIIQVNNQSWGITQEWAKVGLSLLVHETEFILDYYLLNIVLFFHTNHCKLTFAYIYTDVKS